jgi:alkaline phosphatase
MTLGTSGGDNDLNLSKLQWQSASFPRLTEEYKIIRNAKMESMKLDSLVSDSKWAFNFIYEHIGLGDESKGLALNTYEKQELELAYRKSFYSINREIPSEYILYGSHDPFMIAASHMLSRKVGIGWTTFSHTAIPVPIRAFGVGAENFSGFYDNTGIYERLYDLIIK